MPSRDRDEILYAHLEALEETLKGDGKNQPGLIKEVQDVKDWIRDEKTTRRILVLVFSGVFTITGGAVAWGANKLADAVLSRPIVVSPAVATRGP